MYTVFSLDDSLVGGGLGNGEPARMMLKSASLGAPRVTGIKTGLSHVVTVDDRGQMRSCREALGTVMLSADGVCYCLLLWKDLSPSVGSLTQHCLLMDPVMLLWTLLQWAFSELFFFFFPSCG